MIRQYRVSIWATVFLGCVGSVPDDKSSVPGEDEALLVSEFEGLTATSYRQSTGEIRTELEDRAGMLLATMLVPEREGVTAQTVKGIVRVGAEEPAGVDVGRDSPVAGMQLTLLDAWNKSFMRPREGVASSSSCTIGGIPVDCFQTYCQFPEPYTSSGGIVAWYGGYEDCHAVGASCGAAPENVIHYGTWWWNGWQLPGFCGWWF
jgi:hypothetical protein